MKTFQQFCAYIYQLDEFQIGNPLKNPLVKKVTQNPVVKKGVNLAFRASGVATALDPKASPGERVVGALTAVRPYHPTSFASSVTVPAALEIAKQRREAQEKRYTSLIPSGNQPYGTGKPTQIKPLNK